MTTLPRLASLSIARTSLGAVVLGFTLLGLWTASDLWGQAPGKPGAPPKKKRVEEEEEDPAKTPPKRKVIQVDDEDPKDKPGTRPSAPPSGDLKELAKQAKHNGVKRLFRELAVPHDVVTFNIPKHVTPSRERVENVEPISAYLGDDPTKYRNVLTLRPFDHDWNPIRAYNPTLTSIHFVQTYERLAQKEVREFLDESWDKYEAASPRYLSRAETFTAAEQALSYVVRWHEGARAKGKRVGDDWAAIEADLRKQLLDEVMLKQLELFAATKNWDQVLALTRRLATAYTNNADRARIAKPVAALIESALKDETLGEEQKQQARKRLHLLEEEFPDNPVFRPIGAKLRTEAEALLDRAKKLAPKKNDADTLQHILGLIRQAEETWPQTPGLNAFKSEMRAEHPILRVGVRGQLPKYLSPGWACTDAERRAVEMLFEGLVKLSPDKTGVCRYRPGLAEYRPKVVSMGREFQLPRNATWSNQQTLNSGDIRFTVKLLKDGVGSGRSCVWGQLLDKVEVKRDPFQVTLRLNQGYLDPLALMTFKVLPQNQPVESKKFAENPVSSGPFRFDRIFSDEGRECVRFVANPSYGSRPGKRDLPHVQEVRFYAYADPLRELRSDRLDVLLDLTAKDAADLQQKASELNVIVPMPSTSTPNRRIYFLAVNQRKLPDAALRKAIAHAINREQLLDKFFRGPLRKQVHKALNGPFPAGTWACNPTLTNRQDKGSLDLFDADSARSLSQKPAVRNAGTLKLKYPDDDPALSKAMEALRDQVKETTGLQLELVPCDHYHLREDVEQTQSYDLAYYHYDFPDETYWLWPLLGPSGRAASDGNFLNFRDDVIQQTLQTAMSHRHFSKVQEYLRMVHKFFHHDMPFIPLWQLDPLLAYHHDVQPAGLDPLLVFTNVEEWRLRRK
jgi:ABC-type oligopeptide transport system substrate-binding subunit